MLTHATEHGGCRSQRPAATRNLHLVSCCPVPHTTNIAPCPNPYNKPLIQNLDSLQRINSRGRDCSTCTVLKSSGIACLAHSAAKQCNTVLHQLQQQQLEAMAAPRAPLCAMRARLNLQHRRAREAGLPKLVYGSPIMKVVSTTCTKPLHKERHSEQGC